MVRTILVVDDDLRLQEILTEVLSAEGYGVHQAGDGIMALQALEVTAPDLVLSDVRMPRLDGVGLAGRLTQREPPIPIILMGGSASATANDAVPFIAKPFGLTELLTTISTVLGIDRAS
jgi:CheY-like chemotaxis protein